MGEIAAGELTRRTAVGGNDENLRIAGFQISRAVEAVDEVLIDLRCVGPLRALGCGRERGDFRRSGGDQRSEGDLRSVRRPGNAGRSIFDVGEFGGLARIHPANIELRLAIAVGNEGNASTIGRPARGSVAIRAGGEGTMFGAIEVDDPKVGDPAIRRNLRGLTDVDDALAVGRDLRIRSNLNMENIHGFQPISIFLRDAGEKGRQKKDDYEGERTESLRQGSLLSRMHVITKRKSCSQVRREQLLDSSLSFQYRIAVVHRPGEIGVCKCDPAEWSIAQDLSRRRPTLPAEEKARLRA